MTRVQIQVAIADLDRLVRVLDACPPGDTLPPADFDALVGALTMATRKVLGVARLLDRALPSEAVRCFWARHDERQAGVSQHAVQANAKAAGAPGER
jgi:hypothetical protein